MSDSTLPKWFMVVAVLALLWNVMGLAAFVMEVTRGPEAMAQLPEAQQALYSVVPSWVHIAFGVAVIAGVIASIGLVMKKNWAFPLFVISLLGVIAQQTYMFFMSDTFAVMGNAAMVMPIVVLIIAILLVVFSNKWSKQGWLN